MGQIQRTGEADAVPRAGAPAQVVLARQVELVPGALSGYRSRIVVDREDQHRAETPVSKYAACESMS